MLRVLHKKCPPPSTPAADIRAENAIPHQLSPTALYECDILTLSQLMLTEVLSDVDDQVALEFAQKSILTLPPIAAKTSPMQIIDDNNQTSRKRPLRRSISPAQPTRGKQTKTDVSPVSSRPYTETPKPQRVTFAKGTAAHPTQPPTLRFLRHPHTQETQPKKPRYPPVVIERLENWSSHFKILAGKLNRPPNGRPYKNGFRFLPDDETEYRMLQAYFSDLEKETGLEWHSYSPPEEINVKVAIRGLPTETSTEEITEALNAKQFDVEHIKNIKGTQGRPGSIFYVPLRKTQNIQSIYGVTELLNMLGITIEAWRGKKGPSQCRRCQKFRHSSHNYHRQQACVRCGEPHRASECPRPKDEAATCRNCGGPHPANYKACPVFVKEMKNKHGGTVPETSQPRGRKGTVLTELSTVEETAPSSLMAPANPYGGSVDKKKRGKKIKSKPNAEVPAKSAEMGQNVMS
ncbi:unnamed protein product [Leptidea sinapis]|uniref:Pre-C2HC domain-containing protein n=1 Tax=Leptidea sinapis TaxID=189913 RepID=A0A5E4Q5L2_9NEOP|nr:unnamed protein product [Leptidea sinapis]